MCCNVLQCAAADAHSTAHWMSWLNTQIPWQVLVAGSSRSHCVVYLMVEKSHPDGKLEYGKLCLVCYADVQMLLLCIVFFNKSANVSSSKQQSVPSSLKTNLCAIAKQSWQLAASLDAEAFCCHGFI